MDMTHLRNGHIKNEAAEAARLALFTAIGAGTHAGYDAGARTLWLATQDAEGHCWVQGRTVDGRVLAWEHMASLESAIAHVAARVAAGAEEVAGG